MAAMASMPPGLFSAHSEQQTPTTDPYALVDPELLQAIKSLPTFSISNENLSLARKGPGVPLSSLPAPQPIPRVIPGPRGAPDIPVLLFNSAPSKKKRPGLLHIHGGGYVDGANGKFGILAQRIAAACDCVIVSPDYRLAPETRFPGSLEDNYAALRWMNENAEALGIDSDHIAVGGESAGGGHAATLAIAARDRREFRLAFQLLIYPMLDDRTGTTRKVPNHIGKFVWTRESNAFGWTSLLGLAAGSQNVPHGAVPARAEDLSGLPATYIAVGSLDLFVEENIEYARRLVTAGVQTELNVFPGGYHAFDLLAPDAQISKRFAQLEMSALKRGLQI